MQSGNKFFSPMDALALHKSGKIVLRKTQLRDSTGRTYRVMRFDYHNGAFVMFLEFPDGSHQPINSANIRKMGLELLDDKGVTKTDWEDPP